MMEKVAALLREAAAAMVRGAVLLTGGLLAGLNAVRGLLILALVLGAAAYLLYRNPPFKTVGRGEVGLRINVFTGDITEQREGSVLVLPFMHDLRVFALRDQVYRPPTQRADGPSPVQSLEGLSLGADISVRYAIDPARLRAVASNLPDDVVGQIVEPAVQGVIYKTFARYTVREIFSTKREEIQQAVETELRARFAPDGLALRGVLIGKVDLPREYRRGMEALLSEELATEKMRYTLELKDRRVKEVALDGEAEKTRREKTAEAAARETVIAAKAQEEAMKHVLPFKQRQIEQRIHAPSVFARQVDLADQHAAQGETVGREARAQLGLDRLLDLDALGGEDLAHRIACEGLVDGALHRRLDDLAGDIVRQVRGHRAQPVSWSVIAAVWLVLVAAGTVLTL